MHGRIWNITEVGASYPLYEGYEFLDYFDLADYVNEVTNRTEQLDDIKTFFRNYPYDISLSQEGLVVTISRDTLQLMLKDYNGGTGISEGFFFLANSYIPITPIEWIKEQLYKNNNQEEIEYCIHQLFDFHF